ncbi:MAG: DEAD/DEAH box helicase [Lachnospiraceae bacterium]|nr:DEAD/DEAH box helicase [Lachnospiraceae bacterium]
MSDFILSINFDESRKKNCIVIETYEGIIPKLKSKKFSGQLRNININASQIFDNLSKANMHVITEFLNNDLNIQINKNQYMISAACLVGLKSLVEMGCLFYKDKRNGMYIVEKIFYENILSKNVHSIEGVCFEGDKTSIYFQIDESKIKKYAVEITPKVYINLNDSSYPLELKFDYGVAIVDFLSKERQINLGNEYRDFRYEEKIEEIIENSGWILKRNEGFVFCGKDVSEGIVLISESGINVYTNTEKKICVADYSKIRVSYDFDWFSVKGEVKWNEESIDITKLIDLRKKKENWAEYNGQVIMLPKALTSKTLKKDSTTGEVHIDKRKIISAIGLANDLNGSVVHNLNQYIDYNNVCMKIDSNLKKILREYQVVGVKWLLSLMYNNFGACLADDMGLGKTLQIIAYLSDEIFDNSHNLIVVPKTLLINWQREFKKFLPDASVYIYHGSERNINDIKGFKIVLTTYHTLVNDCKLFNGIYFNNLVIDEAQYIKNSKSKAYNVIKSIDASMKIILTGTPIENNLSEFWGLMRLINPDVIEPYSSVTKNQNQLVDRIKLLSSPFLLRRLKRDVLKDLPEKQEQTLLVKLDEQQQKLYDKMLESIRHEILRKNDQFEIKSNSIMLNGLLYLQEICCHPQLLSNQYNGGCYESAKMDLLMELLASLYSNGHKVVVFSRFTKMLSIIEKKINISHMNYFYLDGTTKDRMLVVDEFENSEKGIFLVSLKAGGTGLNLISADTAIIYDPWWNPASERQAEDRIYRIGQERNVMIYRLIAEGTIEEKIQKLQNEKKNLCSEILDGHEVPIAMTVDVMEKLILEK